MKWEWLAKRNVLIITLVAFLAAGLRLTFVARQGAPWGGAEMVRAARSWAQEGRLAHVFSDHTGDSAHVAPVYPILLGTVYRLVGWEGRSAGWGQAMIAVIPTVVSVSLLPIVAFRTRLSPIAGVLGALITACSPLNIWVETSGTWEQPLIAVALIALLLAFVKLHDDGWRSWRLALLVGGMLGFSALLNPVLVPAAALMLLAELALRRGDKRAVMLKMLTLSVCAALVVAPWTLRNYRIFGAIVPIRSNFGLELWIGNNPSANGKTFSSAWDDPKAPMSQPHPYTSPEEAERLTQAGEVQYMRDKLGLASAWISRHPDRFINLTLHRIRLFWFPSSDLWSPSSPGRVLKSLAFSITAAAAWGNLIRLMLMRNPYRWLWLSALIGPSLSYAITHVDPRYRYPIFGLTILLACDFAVSGVRMYRGLPT